MVGVRASVALHDKPRELFVGLHNTSDSCGSATTPATALPNDNTYASNSFGDDKIP